MDRRGQNPYGFAMQPPGGAGISTPQFSNDGKWYWDGRQWVSAVSPDGKYQWTGTAWTPVKKMLFSDYANQSIACAVIGLLCGFMFLFGLYAGVRAYKDLPWKRTQAIVGIVLNTVGCVLLVMLLTFRAAGLGR
jgi:sensor c-di-GMP phosphodiesterase-like protein